MTNTKIYPVLGSAIVLISLSVVLMGHGEYLSYFNFLGGSKPEEIILESDYEWGQDFNRLAVEVAKHPIDHISLGVDKVGATDFNYLLNKSFSAISEDSLVVGWFAVSKSWQRYKGIDMDTCLSPTALVGKTIMLYYTKTPIVPKDCKISQSVDFK